MVSVMEVDMSDEIRSEGKGECRKGGSCCRQSSCSAPGRWDVWLDWGDRWTCGRWNETDPWLA